MHHHVCFIRSESIFHVQSPITGRGQELTLLRVTEASDPVLSWTSPTLHALTLSWTGPILQALTLSWTVFSELSVIYTTHGGHRGCKATWKAFADLSVFLRLGLQECHNVLEGT